MDRSAARRIIELAERFEKQLELYKPPLKSPAHDKTVRLTEKARDDYSNEPVGILLAFAYPDRIAQRRPKEYDRYVLSGGRGPAFRGRPAYPRGISGGGRARR